MATERTVVTEYQETAPGQLPTKKTTAAPTVSTVTALTGAVLGASGTHKSDGQKRNVGDG